MNPYKQIFEDFRRGDISSFYEVVYPELLVYAARILGDGFAFLAEDCVQDAVMKAYDRRRDFPTPAQWRAFLYTCLRNGALNVLRKGQAHSAYLGAVGSDEANAAAALDMVEQETLTLLYAAIETLPAPLLELFHLSFEQGLRNAEVAQRLCVTEITIKKRKARLISLLRERLRPHMDERTLSALLLALANAGG